MEGKHHEETGRKQWNANPEKVYYHDHNWSMDLAHEWRRSCYIERLWIATRTKHCASLEAQLGWTLMEKMAQTASIPPFAKRKDRALGKTRELQNKLQVRVPSQVEIVIRASNIPPWKVTILRDGTMILGFELLRNILSIVYLDNQRYKNTSLGSWLFKYDILINI